jgi:hypothetical protein
MQPNESKRQARIEKLETADMSHADAGSFDSFG